MDVYRLGVEPRDDTNKGESWNEWYPSLKEAQERRLALIQADPFLVGHPTGKDYEILRCTVARLTGKARTMALLRRDANTFSSVVVVAPFYHKPKFEVRDPSACGERLGGHFWGTLVGEVRTKGHCMRCGLSKKDSLE